MFPLGLAWKIFVVGRNGWRWLDRIIENIFLWKLI